jgi:hypothetical protein
MVCMLMGLVVLQGASITVGSCSPPKLQVLLGLMAVKVSKNDVRLT